NEIADLQQRVAALEEAVARSAPPSHGTGGSQPENDPFWALHGVEDRAPEGAVLYTGNVRIPGGDSVRWQYAKEADDLLAEDWTDQASALAALGHPVRLQILHAVLHGTASAAELVDEIATGTSGQIYHHLKELTSSGWLLSPKRGSYSVPGARVVPLLTILLAAGTPQ